MRGAALAALAFTALAHAPALAQAPAGAPASPAPVSLALSGRLVHPRSLAAADLAGLPLVSLGLPASGNKPPAHVSGALLWPLLDQAGWVDKPGRKTRLQHVILARGRDGYAVALSIAEIDPNLEGKQVLVATAKDGTLELVVPGDKRAARRVHDLVALDVE